MTRYSDIDGIVVPDQWDDIVERAEAGDLLDLEPDTPRRRARRVLPAIAVAATVLAAAIAVGVILDDDRIDVATTDPVPQTSEGLPDLVCGSGELLDGSIPDGASPTADGLAFEIGVAPADLPAAAFVASWPVDGVRVQLAVPGFPWNAGLSDRPGRAVDGGTIVEESGGRTVFVGSTGLEEPCDRVEIEAIGGDASARADVVLSAARSLEWSSAARGPVLLNEVSSAADMRRYAVQVAAEYRGDGFGGLQVYGSSAVLDADVASRVGGSVPGWPDDLDDYVGREMWFAVVTDEAGFVPPRGPAGGPAATPKPVLFLLVHPQRNLDLRELSGGASAEVVVGGPLEDLEMTPVLTW